MKKPLLLFFFLTLCTLSKAQSWCPNIGTYWYFDAPNSPNFCNGYVKYDYYQDSLINGNNCQMIRRYRENSCINGSHAGYITPIFTYTNSNKVVYMNDYTSSASVQTQVFDTLFWFNAPIGAKWLMLPQSYNCTYSTACVVTVQDTGHRTVQGINLRWQKVNYIAQSGGPVQTLQDTIYERFGYLRTEPFNTQNFCATAIDIQTSRIFRCYGDNQLTNLKYKYTGACDYYDNTGIPIGIHETKVTDDNFILSPNPAASVLQISSKDKAWENSLIEVQDALGRTALKSAYTSSLDISTLQSGIYFIVFKNGVDLKSFKIIKE
ncbi:MAG: T9SS type A sorting domain-containing protein [Bacteroidota bacterium]